jgi:hypothetical protein
MWRDGGREGGRCISTQVGQLLVEVATLLFPPSSCKSRPSLFLPLKRERGREGDERVQRLKQCVQLMQHHFTPRDLHSFPYHSSFSLSLSLSLYPTSLSSSILTQLLPLEQFTFPLQISGTPNPIHHPIPTHYEYPHQQGLRCSGNEHRVRGEEEEERGDVTSLVTSEPSSAVPHSTFPSPPFPDPSRGVRRVGFTAEKSEVEEGGGGCGKERGWVRGELTWE